MQRKWTQEKVSVITLFHFREGLKGIQYSVWFCLTPGNKNQKKLQNLIIWRDVSIGQTPILHQLKLQLHSS